MALTLPDELLQSTKLTEAELKAELALALFQQERLTLGQAATLAGLPQLDFQRLLASRRIPLHKTVESLYSLSSLPAGWNSYRAKPIGPDVIQAAVRFESNLLKANTPAPHVVPRVQGGIQLEWHLNNIDIEVYIDSSGAMRFYAEDLTDSRAPDELQLPADEAVLSSWLARVSD
jgi:predicted HTH domain antitoxin